MLVYIAQLLLSYLRSRRRGAIPAGFNFPQSKAFEEHALLPHAARRQRASTRRFICRAACSPRLAWFFVSQTFAGYRMRVAGLAPAAAAYAGFSEKRNIWLALLIGGGAAGLAGICEVAGPIGLLQPSISPGYGFAAIIVAFVGRLHPLGIVLASLLMSLLYLGGEVGADRAAAAVRPSPGLFQGVLLFYLLAADLFITFRLRTRDQRTSAAPSRQHPANHARQARTLMSIRATASRSSPARSTAATPLIYRGAGRAVGERAGVLNLGVEGMMLIGAVTAFAVGVVQRQPDARLSSRPCAAGVALSLLFAFLDADAADQPGRDGPGAHAVRHRA